MLVTFIEYCIIAAIVMLALVIGWYIAKFVFYLLIAVALILIGALIGIVDIIREVLENCLRKIEKK